jgi:competence ComEA-like helix-hairpin-helix protein
MKLSLLFFLFLLLPSVLAKCESNQIDINTASLSDLDKITSIGPKKAQAIIDTRPYFSIDDLINVTGIGEKTLSKIKMEGLACVSSEISITQSQEIGEEKSEEMPVPETDAISEKEEDSNRESKITARVIDNSPIILEKETTENIINLNSDINSGKKILYESRSEIVRKYLIYAFALFLLVIMVFLLFEKNGRTKNYSDDDY